MGRVFYCTREEVQDAFDVREAADRSAQIDSAIASASDDIDGWLNRHKHGLAPRLATRYFDWPQRFTQSWRLWLDENELISVTSLTSGGTTIASSDYFLEPVNSGPPYTNIQIDLSSSAAFQSGSTGQRAISVAGVWGHSDESKPAGLLDGAVNASVTAVNVSDGSLVGVGSVLRADSERMLVTGRSALTTGQVLVSAMDALKQDQTVDVADGTQLHAGETIIIDNERMKIVSISGNNATVKRAHDGSTLAAHSLGATVYALRALTVERGALGTTAASHSDEAPLTQWAVPDLVRDLCRGEAITRLEQEWSAYGARVYSDEAERDSSGTEVVSGRGLTDLRKSCARRYKRKFRKAAV
jgi:carbonic anhydrase/acetyltransferase-like protein (isoleucine patch superfamily)